MIAKIVTGKTFGGAVRYLTEKSGYARMLDSDGIDTRSIKDIIGSFNFQRKARPEKTEVVGHISLSFHKDDAPRLTDEFMTVLARGYMQRMGITDTQYLVVRHTDTQHPHLHILYNRVKYDAKLVRSHNERIRSVAVCKAMKRKYGLTFSEGKEHVKTEKLHDPDKVKYALYDAVKALLPGCLSLSELARQLRDKGIESTLIHRGDDPANEVQGVRFTLNGQTLKASQVDRKFSYANLLKAIERNKTERERQAQEARNPMMFGIRLTDEQLREVKDGQPVYLEGMRHKGKMFDGYLVMDDNLKHGWAYIRDPREWVKFGKYEMRRMDKDLIEAGFVTRALVKWWGGMGQTARPFLWRENGKEQGGEPYRESWDDPRMPEEQRKKLEQGHKEQCERLRTPPKPKKKGGKGI